MKTMEYILKMIDTILRMIADQGRRIDALEAREVQKPVDKNEWIDTVDFAREFHVSKRAQEEHRRKGNLPFHKEWGKVYYLRSEIDAALIAGKSGKGGKP
jgi:hypothetical protein